VHDLLLEDESLISNLADDEAKVFIQWALKQADAWVSASFAMQGNPDVRRFLHDKVGRLRSIMEGINSFVGERQRLEAAEAESRLTRIFLTDEERQGQGEIIRAGCAALVAEMAGLSQMALVQRLLALADQAFPMPTTSVPVRRTKGHRRTRRYLLAAAGLALAVIAVIVLYLVLRG